MMTTRYHLSALLPLIVLATGIFSMSPHPAVGQESANHSVELRPGVVIDPDRRVAYLMNPKGGIDALNLAHGERIWSTNEAAKPLVLVGDLLVSQTEPSSADNVLRIVALDTKQGGRQAVAKAVELPP